MTVRQTQAYDSNWQDKYKSSITTPAEAVSRIRPGNRVFIGTGCAQPQELVRALAERGKALADVEVIHLLTMGEAPYATTELADSFRVNSFFISDNIRSVVQQGLGDYTPVFLSDIPRLFTAGELPLDAAFIQVTPPNERGLCSFGVSVDIVKSAAENASLVVAEVNSQMPWTAGSGMIDINDIDLLIPTNRPIIEFHPPVPDSVTRQIGEYIAALVDDHSTLELGIGRIPQAVLEFLKSKHDLGIHTEMFTDTIIDLIESGVITGNKKTLDRGKVVASFCMGTQKLYDYVNNNPAFAFHPTEYVNDPYVISRQHKQISINVALEVDLTGQVCADSLGSQFYSGIGGQVDFNRGAARSLGGKAIIALPSTARKSTISRIVSRLSPGAGVVTTRGDVHYVVTEYGAAYLHGKTVQERVIALISISHPDFRARLFKEAVEAKYIRPDQARIEGKIAVGPPDFRSTFIIDDGTTINFRSIRPTDESRFRDLFYALSQATVYYRFMSHMTKLSRKQTQDFVYIDHRTELAIVGTVPESHGEEIVAIGRYYLDQTTNYAEVAFVVRDTWQNKGIGAHMLAKMCTIAKRHGIRGFTAEVLRENRPMQAVLNGAPCQVKSELREGIYSYHMDFA